MQKISNQNKKVKIISTLLLMVIILPAFLFFIPEQADAQLGVPVGPDAVWMPILSDQSATLKTIAINTTAISKATATSAIANAKLTWWQLIIKELLMAAAKLFLQKITQATINWINSGFSGSPLFIQNPGSFFQQIGKQEVERIVTTLGYNSNMYPFGQNFALNIINSYKRQFADNAAYSLAQVMQNPAQFANCAFSTCGWNGLLINSQYTQNNYLGFRMTAMDQLARQLQGTVQNAAQTVRTTLQQSMGFLSPKTCPSNLQYNNGVNEFQKPPAFDPSSVQNNTTTNPDPTCSPGNLQVLQNQCSAEAPPAGCATVDQDLANCQAQWATWNTNLSHQQGTAYNQWYNTNGCPGGLQVSTPGGVVANHIINAVSTTWRQSELATALGSSISAILDALINHFMSQGLSALGGLISGTSTTDNWSYQGVSLTSGTAPPPASNGALTVASSVNLNVDDTPTTTVSGGTMPYNVTILPNSTKNPGGTTVTDGTVAIAQISGNTLTVTGLASGTTSLVVTDSSSPMQSATITVTVGGNAVTMDFNNPAPLNITINSGDSTTISMTGGSGSYSVQSPSDDTIAPSAVAGNTLDILGGAPNLLPSTTSVTVADTSNPPILITVTITVINNTNGSGGSTTNNLSVTDTSVGVGGTSPVTISGGTPPYAIAQEPDSSIANTSDVSGNTFTVTGLAAGTTSLVVIDSSTPTQTAGATVTVTGGSGGTGGTGGGGSGNVVNVDSNTQNFPVEVTLSANSSAEIVMSDSSVNGAGDTYGITSQPNSDVAKATQTSPKTIAVTGVAPGTTIFFITASSGKQIQVDVTVQ